jgi:hypothetical protein
VGVSPGNTIVRAEERLRARPAELLFRTSDSGIARLADLVEQERSTCELSEANGKRVLFAEGSARIAVDALAHGSSWIEVGITFWVKGVVRRVLLDPMVRVWMTTE